MTLLDNVQVEQHGPKRLASVRHLGPYDEVGEAWGSLMKWGWTKMLFKQPESFGLAFDDPEVTAAELLRYEAGMVIGAKVKPEDMRVEILMPVVA